MIRFCRFPAILLLLAALPLLTGVGPPSPPLQGRWVLVEQTYGRGKANLAEPDGSLRLEFLREENRGRGRVWRGEDRSRQYDWPALIAGDRSLPLEIVEKNMDFFRGTALVRYRVRPSEGDDLVLHVEESYRVEENGKFLVGDVEVTFRLGEEERGSYVLHRRFERLP